MKTSSFPHALEAYAGVGVDVERALSTLSTIPLSLHCWQGDDVGGFETTGASLTGSGLQTTGNYPGKARTIEELRQDLDCAYRLLPGKHRLSLHASYAELSGKKIERAAYEPAQFQGWIDWSKERGLGLDFNPTYFSHPLAKDGLTLSHPDAAIRQYWIDHGIACRKIGAAMGRALGTPCVTNFWIPDGSKDMPFDRKAPRRRLEAALDAIFAVPVDAKHNLDALECKLFGIGSESYVVGSHEFYLGYTVRHQKLLCLDAGHFHPTESLADKISSVLQFVPGLLLHVSRGVRWDSDHVVLLDDATRGIMEELVRGDFLPRTHIGLDFFDASINRIAAWVIGARAALKALLIALLEPAELLRQAEQSGNFSARLGLMELEKALPWGIVWEEYCQRQGVPGGWGAMKEIEAYERTVLAKRN